MKKVFWGMLSALFLTMGCNQEEGMANADQSQGSEISLSFKALNDSILKLPNYDAGTTATRGFWDSFKRAIKVAEADLYGAAGGLIASGEIASAVGLASGGTGYAVVLAVGGTIGAAGASLRCYDEVVGRVSIDDLDANTTAVAYQEAKTQPITYVRLDFPEEYEYMNMMGGLHNEIINQSYTANAVATPYPSPKPVGTRGGGVAPPPTTGEPTTGGGGTTTSITDLLEQESISSVACTNTPEYQADEAKLLESEEFAQACIEIIDETAKIYNDENGDSEAFLENLGGQSTENEKIIMEYYTRLYNTYPQSINDVVLIANEYIKKITAMVNLTDSERETLYLAIAVSVNSAYYWTNVFSTE